MIVLFLVTLLVEIIIFQLILAHSIWLNLPSQKINTDWSLFMLFVEK